MTSIPVIDLFAGAGGIGIGAAAAGGDIRLSMEWDRHACATLRANAVGGHRVIEGDIAGVPGRDLRALAGLGVRDPLVIVGGPPCQAFSKAAYWTGSGDDAAWRAAKASGVDPGPRPGPVRRAKPDARRDLSGVFMRQVAEAEADGFLFENVRSILHPRNRGLVDRLLATARKAGYRTVLHEANAAAHGVPQMRERVFILGSRHGVPVAPAATHRVKDGGDPALLPPPACGPALLPFADDAFHEPEEVVRGRWAAALARIPPGMNYKALTAWAGCAEPLFEAERRFWSFLLTLHPDRPSWTIAAGPGPWVGPFHWTHRRLRTAEMAALQTFPLQWRFTGTRRQRIRQIGNAAPCRLVERMAAAVFAAVR